MLDLEDQLNILPAIQPVASSALFRRDGWELGFPISKNVRLHARETADDAYTKVQLIGDFLLTGLPRYFRRGMHDTSMLRCHGFAGQAARTEEGTSDRLPVIRRTSDATPACAPNSGGVSPCIQE